MDELVNFFNRETSQILDAKCNNLLLCTWIFFQKSRKRSFPTLNRQVWVLEAFKLPEHDVPICNGFVRGCLHHAEGIQYLARFSAAVLPRPFVHFCKSQLVGIAKKRCSLSNLTYLSLGSTHGCHYLYLV